MRRVFIDTGFGIALIDKSDQHHVEAVATYHNMSGLGITLITSEFVLFETATYLNCSLKNHAVAVAFIKSMQSSDIELISMEQGALEKALEIFSAYSQLSLSMVDCHSFALMRRLRTHYFAGYDRHFIQMGFTQFN